MFHDLIAVKCNYHFFKHLNNFLQGKCFHNQQEAENAFQEFDKSWSTDFYSTGIRYCVMAGQPWSSPLLTQQLGLSVFICRMGVAAPSHPHRTPRIRRYLAEWEYKAGLRHQLDFSSHKAVIPGCPWVITYSPGGGPLRELSKQSSLQVGPWRAAHHHMSILCLWRRPSNRALGFSER